MNGELSFEINKDQCEELREILKQQGIRHFKLEMTDFGEFDVVEYKEYQKLEQKVDRLNNIIDKLEKYCEENSKLDHGSYDRYGDVLDKLKELKNGDNND